MKRLDLPSHLFAHGCKPLREGVRPFWWHYESLNKPSGVPRHGEINDHLTRKICRDPGVAEA